MIGGQICLSCRDLIRQKLEEKCGFAIISCTGKGQSR